MRHTLSVTVEDKPGVLARISSMCSLRGFNIRSLAVGPIHQPGLSRITLVVDDVEVEQITKQLHKLVNVLKISELGNNGMSLEREVMIVRVAADPGIRREVRDAAEVFGAETIDVGATTITFSLCAHPDRLSEFLDLVDHYGVIDLVKSGRIAMARDTKAQENGSRRTARGAAR
jgi:acetolactate synthase-1/3 small subunit